MKPILEFYKAGVGGAILGRCLLSVMIVMLESLHGGINALP